MPTKKAPSKKTAKKEPTAIQQGRVMGRAPKLGRSNISVRDEDSLEILRQAKQDPRTRWIFKLASEQDLPVQIRSGPLNSSSTFGLYMQPGSPDLRSLNYPGGTTGIFLNGREIIGTGETGTNPRTLSHEMIHYLQNNIKRDEALRNQGKTKGPTDYTMIGDHQQDRAYLGNRGDARMVMQSYLEPMAYYLSEPEMVDGQPRYDINKARESYDDPSALKSQEERQRFREFILNLFGDSLFDRRDNGKD